AWLRLPARGDRVRLRGPAQGAERARDHDDGYAAARLSARLPLAGLSRDAPRDAVLLRHLAGADHAVRLGARVGCRRARPMARARPARGPQIARRRADAGGAAPPQARVVARRASASVLPD